MLPETNPTPFENPVQEASITAPTNPVQIESKTTMGLIGLVGILMLVAATTLGGYKLYQQKDLSKEIATANQLLEQQKNQLLAEDNKQVDDEYKKVFLDSKLENRLYWTNIITRFDESLPQNDSVNVESFTGSDDGLISFSANTTINSLSPFLDTAILIESLKTKSFFNNVFVPSVSSVINEQGREFLSYSVRLEYVKDTSDTKLIEPATVVPKTISPSAPSNENINSALEELKRKATEANKSTTTQPANTETNAN